MSVKKSVNLIEQPGTLVGGFVKGGTLIPAYRAVYVSGPYPKDVKKCLYSRGGNAWFMFTDSEMWYSDDGISFLYNDDYSCERPFIVEDYYGQKVCSIVFMGKTVKIRTSYGFAKFNAPYSFSCGVIHCGRFFGGFDYTVCWSGTNDFNDWEQGVNASGNLELDASRGKILNMLVYGGKIVAVCEYGLTVFSMYGTPENFSVDLTDTDSDKIYLDSAQIVDGKLYFCTVSGIKYFDGRNIHPVKTRYSIANAVSSAVDGWRYFLSGYCRERDRTVIFCLDTADGESCIIEEEASSLFVSDKPYFIKDGKYGYLESSDASLKLICGRLDFGTDRFKTVTKIRVTGSAKIKIDNDMLQKNYTVTDGCVRPHFKGKQFAITVESSSALKEVTVTAEVMNGV